MKDAIPSPVYREGLLARLAALATPHRPRIVAALSRGGRDSVCRLAREIGTSRPLLHPHLRKLEEAALVTSRLALSADGKALNCLTVSDFDIVLTPAAIAQAAATPTVHPASSAAPAASTAEGKPQNPPPNPSES